MYGPEMDIWGAGCILFELTTLYPLFPGTDEVDQINRIHRVLGTPPAAVLSRLKKHASTHAKYSFPPQQGIGLSKLLPDAKDNCLDLLTASVAYDATKRITSSNAIAHPYLVGAAIDVKENGRPKAFVRSSSVATNTASSIETTSSEKVGIENKPVTKTRSMVSILLARVRFAYFKLHAMLSLTIFPTMDLCKQIQSDKKDFIKGARERNRKYYRQEKEAGQPKITGFFHDKTTARGSLPKLKSLITDTNCNESKPSNLSKEQKSRLRQPKKYTHVQSSGYGGIGSVSMQQKTAFASSRKAMPNGNKLPPLGEPEHVGRSGYRRGS